MKLKPCPFCGKQPIIGPDDPKTEGSAWAYVSCQNNRCSAMPEVQSYSNGPGPSRRNAARKWNTRK